MKQFHTELKSDFDVSIPQYDAILRLPHAKGTLLRTGKSPTRCCTAAEHAPGRRISANLSNAGSRPQSVYPKTGLLNQGVRSPRVALRDPLLNASPRSEPHP